MKNLDSRFAYHPLPADPFLKLLVLQEALNTLTYVTTLLQQEAARQRATPPPPEEGR